jgi:hypothetical protein
MTAATDQAGLLPGWLPDSARLYLRHIEAGLSMRALARTEGCHASTVLRKVRRFENRRDDPLIDEALDRFGRAFDRTSPVAPADAPRSANPGTREDTTSMTAAMRRPRAADETTVHTEARRVLRRLCEPETLLAIAPDLDKAVVMKGTIRIAVVDRTVAQAFAIKDWIAIERAGRVTTYAITGVGRAALRRMIAGGREGSGDAADAFGDQHRDWGEREVADSDGRRRVRCNLAESPMSVLARRRDKDGKPFLAPELVAAGERLREDFEIAQIGPRVAQNWDRFLTGGQQAPAGSGSGPAEGPRGARERVALALRDLGPGLGDMVLRCCCFLEGLEVVEKRLGWSARSGKIVLRIALIRLAKHYREVYGDGLPLIG